MMAAGGGTVAHGAARALDVICMGRAAVDLYGQQIGGRLEDMQSFAKYLGGSSGNLAAGLARLGVRSSMLTRVGDEQMGRFVREALAREGVDVSHVVTDPRRLTGLVILGIGGENSFPHIFYRENCADLAIEPDDFDEEYIASSRALAITGTHLSTEHSRAVVLRAVRFARRNDVQVVLDIDYRPVLWGLVAPGSGEERFVASEAATASMRELLPQCDLVAGTEEEIRIAGKSDSTIESMHAIRARSAAAIVVKRGAIGCSVFDGAIPADIDSGVSVAGVEVEVFNTLGAGDAFLSGFLLGWLDGAAWSECGVLGNACGRWWSRATVARRRCPPGRNWRTICPGRPEFAGRTGTARSPTCTGWARAEKHRGSCSFSHSISADGWRRSPGSAGRTQRIYGVSSRLSARPPSGSGGANPASRNSASLSTSSTAKPSCHA